MKTIILSTIISLFLISCDKTKGMEKPETTAETIETTPEITPKTITPELDLEANNIQNQLYIKPDFIPIKFKYFYELNLVERLSMVMKACENKNLDIDIINFFKAEIFNKKWNKTIRNNMANALIKQHKVDPNLHNIFIKMLDYENEDPIWRKYCISFLSRCYYKSNDKRLITQTMIRYANGDDSNAETALVHLAHLEKRNNLRLMPNFGKKLAIMLEAPETHLNTKISILTIIGKRGDKSLLPLVLKYARQNESIALKCNAIGALGLMGNNSDLPCIIESLDHKNGLIRQVALGAMNRIQKREQLK